MPVRHFTAQIAASSANYPQERKTPPLQDQTFSSNLMRGCGPPVIILDTTLKVPQSGSKFSIINFPVLTSSREKWMKGASSTVRLMYLSCGF